MAFDVRRLDIYRKIPKDLTQPTVTGAIISICCCGFMGVLFFSEFFHFITTSVTSELFVDNPGNNDRILVRLNITLPQLSCNVLGLDIQDEMGRHEVGFIENIVKTPVGIGNVGCRFEGTFHINKPENIEGSFNPLKGIDKSTAEGIESHDYVMKIVPTIYEKLDTTRTESYQYTYAYKSSIAFSHSGRIMPAIWFRYDLTPITVKYTEKRQPLYSFLTTVCAIVGGTFTVAGLIDSMVFTASEVFKKFELGKLIVTSLSIPAE